MDINVKIDFGPDTLAAINGLAAALAPVKKENPLKAVKAAEPAKAAEPVTKPEPAPVKEPAQTAAVKVTVEMIRELFNLKKQEGKRDAFAALLAEHGVKSIGAIPDELKHPIYEAAKAL